MTARHYANRRPARGTWVCTSPYTGHRVIVVGGREHGNKVRLQLANGREMEVDASQRIKRGDPQ